MTPRSPDPHPDPVAVPDDPDRTAPPAADTDEAPDREPAEPEVLPVDGDSVPLRGLDP